MSYSSVVPAPFRLAFTRSSVSISLASRIAVNGTFASLPKFGKFPKPRRINVYFGEPIHPQRLAKRDETSRLIYTELTNELAKRIRALYDQHHGR